jgi:glycosyltransferase involved in cell wall biosynthesis
LAYFHPKFEEIGGAEILALKHAELLRAGGVAVEFVTFSVRGGFWASALAGWTVHVVPKRAAGDFWRGWTRMGKLDQRADRALPLLRTFDTVLASNHPSCTMLGRLELGARKIWYCHEPPRSLFPRETLPYGAAQLERLGPELPALLAVQRELGKGRGPFSPYRAPRRANLAAIPRLHRHLFNSGYTRDNAEGIYGPLRGQVIHPVIDFPAAPAAPARLDRERPRILAQARLTGLKNLETVIDGFKLFRLAHPGAELHVVGDGPLLADLQVRAGQGPGAGGAHFHGFLSGPDLDALRARCAIFALLPIDEPFGMVYPEMAARGLLLVGPDHGGPREILEAGALGWVCDALAPEQLRDALEAICACSDADLAARAAAADQACRERFSAEALAPRLLEAVR